MPMLFDQYKQTIWYCTYAGRTRKTDADGNLIGQKMPSYNEPVPLDIHVGWARGSADMDIFGIALDYDKPMVTDIMDCPIDENTVLFVDKQPEFDDNDLPMYDYIVKRVAKSKNYITYAIKKVNVS